MKKRSRLFALTEYLRGRRTGVTAEALAERFGVTVRTIYRDLDALRDAHLPVSAERGPGGGFALDRSYTLPPVNFTAREAALIALVGRWASELRLIPFTETLAAAVDKVRGALDKAGQREVRDHLDQLHFIGVPTPPVSRAIRRAVEEAWFEGAPLEVSWTSSEGSRERALVRVRGALCERTMTLLIAIDEHSGEERRLRLDRLDGARVVSGRADG